MRQPALRHPSSGGAPAGRAGSTERRTRLFSFPHIDIHRWMAQTIDVRRYTKRPNGPRRPSMNPPLSPISSAAAWTGAELARSDEWIHRLAPVEVAAAQEIAAHVHALGRPLADL